LGSFKFKLDNFLSGIEHHVVCIGRRVLGLQAETDIGARPVLKGAHVQASREGKGGKKLEVGRKDKLTWAVSGPLSVSPSKFE